jgi:aminopeptidase N
VDLVAHHVALVRLNGREVDPDSGVASARIALTGLRETNELVVEATHRESGRRHGLRRTVDPRDQEVYVWTHFEPFHARRVFACFDQPDLKASFRFTVRAPAEWTCVGNSGVDRVSEDGLCRVWQFAGTPRISTYITAVCAGAFHREATEHNGVALAVYAPRSLADVLDAEAGALLEVARQALDCFGDAFGVPAAFPQLLGNVAGGVRLYDENASGRVRRCAELGNQSVGVELGRDEVGHDPSSARSSSRMGSVSTSPRACESPPSPPDTRRRSHRHNQRTHRPWQRTGAGTRPHRTTPPDQ